MLRGQAGKDLVRRAIEEGLIRPEDRPVPSRDGRAYVRRFLVAGSVTPPLLPTMTKDELRGQREVAGLTQSALARRLHISATAVNRWEGKTGVPRGRVTEVRAALAAADRSADESLAVNLAVKGLGVGHRG